MHRGHLILNSGKVYGSEKKLVDNGIPRSSNVCVLILYAYFKFTIRNIPCAVSRGYVIGLSIGAHIIHIQLLFYMRVVCDQIFLKSAK